MTTVAAVGVGCATAVTVVRWRLEACAMQQPMTTQTTMGMMIKSTTDTTVDPTIIPTILLAGGRNMKTLQYLKFYCGLITGLYTLVKPLQLLASFMKT